MRAKRVLAPVAVAAAGIMAGRAASWAAIRATEDLDIGTIDLPGGLVALDGSLLHVIDRGSGPVLLMIHGFGASTATFRKQIETLAAEYRVVAPDLPGFGYTLPPPLAQADFSHTAQAHLLIRLLDRLGIERATLIGHSMGGAIAMRCAVMSPRRVDRLVLVCAAAPDRRPPLPPAWMVRAGFPFLAALMHRGPSRLRRTLPRTVYDPSLITPEVRTMYRRPWRRPGYAEGLLRLALDVRNDPPLPLPSVATRSLLLWGQADELVPLSVGHRLHRELPDARLEVVPRAGHLVLEEQAERATTLIRRFLAEPPHRVELHD